MTGWRIGFAGAPVALIKAMDKLQSQSTSNTNSIAQAAAVEALTGPQESIEAMRKIFEERRNLVVEMLNKAPGSELPQAGGRVLRLSLDPWLHRQDQPRRQADHRRRKLRPGAAGGDRRRGGARLGVLLSRAFPHQLRQRDRGAARRLHPHPALLRRTALMPAFAERLEPRPGRRQRADDDQGARAAGAGRGHHLADHRRAELRQPAARDRGGACRRRCGATRSIRRRTARRR